MAATSRPASVQELSASTQTYLKAIWGLQEWGDEPATTSRIAERTGLAPSTVSDALRKLAEQGLVEHAPYRSVTLTPTGRTHAVAMVRRHRLIESFLSRVLHYSWDEVHAEAEVLEHAVSDLLVERIDALLGHPDRDPHGDPIPSATGTVTPLSAIRLTDVTAAGTVVVERISDADPQRLQFFASAGIVVGARLHVQQLVAASDTVHLRLDGSSDPVVLGRAATDAIWVSTDQAS
jgi:DtxR family Mn-dependent transcriptional regulator